MSESKKSKDILTNGWINLGKVVSLKKRDGEEKPRKALQLANNVEITVTQRNFNGSTVVRTFGPKSYFNVTPEVEHLNMIHRGNEDKLEKALAHHEQYPFILADVSVAPAQDYDRNEKSGSSSFRKPKTESPSYDLEDLDVE